MAAKSTTTRRVLKVVSSIVPVILYMKEDDKSIPRAKIRVSWVVSESVAIKPSVSSKRSFLLLAILRGVSYKRIPFVQA